MDTVKVSATGLLRHDIVQALNGDDLRLTSGMWEIKGTIQSRRLGGKVRKFTAVRSAPHMFVYGEEDQVMSATFHVPEIIHGFNGIQIKSQNELDSAIALAKGHIEELLNTPVRFMEFRRIDFAYNFPCAPGQVVAGLHGLRHPSIRKDGARFQNNGFQLTGKDFTLSIYSKSHHRCRRDGFPRDGHFQVEDNHLRVEVQAKTKTAVRRLYSTDKDSPVCTLDHARLWTGFRKFVSRLPARTTTSDDCTLHSAIALLHQNGISHPSGLPALNWWLGGKSAETVRKDLRKIQSIKFSASHLSLIDLIPADLPTTFLDVLPDGTTRESSVLTPIVS